ncbi:MAG: acetate/propionate family kinase [Rhodopila sp.]
MDDAILAINAGSSSVKFAVAEAGDHAVTTLVKGKLTRLDQAPHFTATTDAGEVIADTFWEPTGGRQEILFGKLVDWLDDHLDGHTLLAAGHRVVHGGTRFTAPVVVTPRVLDDLADLIPLAPLHQPHNLGAIRAMAAAHPHLPQVACFDTAFHAGHSDAATRFALPRALHEDGVRRYGFHGLSYEFIARQLARVAPDLARGRVVVAHLGNGASLCAMFNGRSIDSTMGFTALDGLPMGTRTGSIDAGVILYLLEQGMGHETLQHLLYEQSGLLGMSGGIGSDMRALLASDRLEAAQAVDYFVYRAVRNIGAMAACLGGLDGLVFTAGIGERSAEIRARIGRGCAWLGIDIDPAANTRGAGCISSAMSRAAAWVIPTDEEQMIALHAIEALQVAAPDDRISKEEFFHV